MKAVPASLTTFQAEVVDSTTPVCVVFGRAGSSATDRVLRELEPTKVKVVFVDIDTSDGGQIALSCGVRFSPSVSLYRNGLAEYCSFSRKGIPDYIVEALK